MSEQGKRVSSESDLVLVDAAINGDVDSFTELCRRYYPAMVAIAHSLLGDRHLAEDVAQETFARACRELSRLRNKNRFPSWLAVICRNTSRDMARTREDLCSLEGRSIASPNPEQGALSDAVREAISTLPTAAREIVFLRYYNSMTYEQISGVLGISEAAVNGRLKRAKKEIAHYLYTKGLVEVRL